MAKISDLIASLRGARANVEQLDRDLSRLDDEQAELDQTPPHVDDIVQSWIAGLEQYQALARQRLGWVLSPENWGIPHSAQGAAHPQAFLELPHIKPGGSGMGFAGNFDHRSRDASAAMLALLLGDLIRPRIAGIVAEVMPFATSGLRAAERQKRQARIDAERARLERERAELIAQLDAARAAAGN